MYWPGYWSLRGDCLGCAFPPLVSVPRGRGAGDDQDPKPRREAAGLAGACQQLARPKAKGDSYSAQEGINSKGNIVDMYYLIKYQQGILVNRMQYELYK